jgi:antitoxin (DNA-binding transcriptional repressor) of toxin-antitoxin stability system
LSTISVHDIQSDPSAFLRRITAGEAMLVVEDDRPIANVQPVAAPLKERRPYGLCAGQFVVPADFNDPLPDEILSAFEGV